MRGPLHRAGRRQKALAERKHTDTVEYTTLTAKMLTVEKASALAQNLGNLSQAERYAQLGSVCSEIEPLPVVFSTRWLAMAVKDIPFRHKEDVADWLRRVKPFRSPQEGARTKTRRS